MSSKRGVFIQDASGLCHYRFQALGTVEDAAEDALINSERPAWFWFNGTFAPIEAGDTPDTLISRWNSWRTSYQEDPKAFFAELEGYALGK